LSADPQRAGAIANPGSRAIRIFDARETARLETECRGYILYLENIGIISAAQRELVIDRLLALDVQQIDVEHVKWVVLMVLFSQPGQQSAYLRMEDLVFDNRLQVVH
jgi:Smg protein